MGENRYSVAAKQDKSRGPDRPWQPKLATRRHPRHPAAAQQTRRQRPEPRTTPNTEGRAVAQP